MTTKARRAGVASLGVCLGLGLTFAACDAAADQVSGTRSELLVESAHKVEVTLEPSHATLRVRRTVFNGGPRHDQAMFFIDVPYAAVATGLATLGTLNGRPHWFRGELLEAEEAAAKYRELTGIGGYYPKDPALLSWRNPSLLALQVFPCAPKAHKSIEYTLTMPTEYEGGRHFVELPRLGTEKLPASVVAYARDPRARLFVGDEPYRPGTAIDFRSGEDVRIALEVPSAPPLSGELAAVEVGPKRALVRYRIEAARRMSTVPRGARIAIVIDGSHSLDSGERRGAIRAAHAYLSHFEDAEVEIVAFDRKLHPLYRRLVPVDRARSDLEKLQIAPGNGSNVDRALLYADQLLAATPPGRARRILVLTDARTRSSLSPELLAESVEQSGALLHIGVINGDIGANLFRDDEHPWAHVARASGGLVWRTTVSSFWQSASELEPIFEEWARPKSLDNATLTGEGLAADLERREVQLVEGEALSALELSTTLPRRITLSGELWATPASISSTPDADAGRRWSALVFGSALLAELSEPEMMVLARHGGAVSPVTSYLAIEPGVRPSTEGLDWSGTGLGLSGVGFGAGGCGAARVRSRSSFDHEGHLRAAIAEHARRCGVEDRAWRVRIETTLHEIVDVTDVSFSNVVATPVRCLREAIWGLSLPFEFDADHATWVIHT